MSLLQSKDGLHYFTFEHSRDYQQVQFKFMDAVDSMNNNNILVRDRISNGGTKAGNILDWTVYFIFKKLFKIKMFYWKRGILKVTHFNIEYRKCFRFIQE